MFLWSGLEKAAHSWSLINKVVSIHLRRASILCRVAGVSTKILICGACVALLCESAATGESERRTSEGMTQLLILFVNFLLTFPRRMNWKSFLWSINSKYSRAFQSLHFHKSFHSTFLKGNSFLDVTLRSRNPWKFHSHFQFSRSPEDAQNDPESGTRSFNDYSSQSSHSASSLSSLSRIPSFRATREEGNLSATCCSSRVARITSEFSSAFFFSSRGRFFVEKRKTFQFTTYREPMKWIVL